METGTSAAVLQWRPSYRRATVMQASLAAIGLLTAIGAWVRGRGTVGPIAGLLLGSGIPLTLIVIFPPNHELDDPELDVASGRAAHLLAKWNRLHVLRSIASLGALVRFRAIGNRE